MLRYYIPEGGINGGVEMPRIKAINLTTGKELDAPARIMSGIRGEMELPGAAFTSVHLSLMHTLMDHQNIAIAVIFWKKIK